MITTVFIILHYKFYKITSNCIQSLLKLSSINECKIIIFDNGSNNGSYEKLEEFYLNNPLIVLHKSNDNLGFSEGNNKAYTIAQKYSPRFIITLNNDIVIQQRDFLLRIYEIYKQENFHILGPDVFAPLQKEHQSPLYPVFPSREQLEEKKQSYLYILQNLDRAEKKELWNRRKGMVRRYVPMSFIEIFRFVKKKAHLFNGEIDDYKQNHQNCVLHGCCLIFSKQYIRENDKLFEPDTRFYHEELLLTLKCQTFAYIIKYNPEIQVIHYHEFSTRKSAGTVKEYLIKHSQNMLSAFEILDKTLKENPWQKNH